jgi:CheY-like chemotaxis protein
MTKLILLVEDNASDEKLALLAFKRCGVACEIAVARDGADALDYLFATGAYHGRDRMALPALTLLDLKLPKISGLEVLRRIRAVPETRLLPIVVLTASRQDEDLTRAYSLGANAYLRSCAAAEPQRRNRRRRRTASTSARPIGRPTSSPADAGPPAQA